MPGNIGSLMTHSYEGSRDRGEAGFRRINEGRRLLHLAGAYGEFRELDELPYYSFRGAQQFGEPQDHGWASAIDQDPEHVGIDRLSGRFAVLRGPTSALPCRLDVGQRPQHVNELGLENVANLRDH